MKKALLLFIIVISFSFSVFAIPTARQLRRATLNAQRLVSLENNPAISVGQSEVIITLEGESKHLFASFPMAVIHYYAETPNSNYVITGRLLGQIEPGDAARFVVENGNHYFCFTPSFFNPEDNTWYISRDSGLANSSYSLTLRRERLALDDNIMCGVYGIFNLSSNRLNITIKHDNKTYKETAFYPSLIQKENLEGYNNQNLWRR